MKKIGEYKDEYVIRDKYCDLFDIHQHDIEDKFCNCFEVDNKLDENFLLKNFNAEEIYLLKRLGINYNLEKDYYAINNIDEISKVNEKDLRVFADLVRIKKIYHIIPIYKIIFDILMGNRYIINIYPYIKSVNDTSVDTKILVPHNRFIYFLKLMKIMFTYDDDVNINYLVNSLSVLDNIIILDNKDYISIISEFKDRFIETKIHNGIFRILSLDEELVDRFNDLKITLLRPEFLKNLYYNIKIENCCKKEKRKKVDEDQISELLKITEDNRKIVNMLRNSHTVTTNCNGKIIEEIQRLYKNCKFLDSSIDIITEKIKLGNNKHDKFISQATLYNHILMIIIFCFFLYNFILSICTYMRVR